MVLRDRRGGFNVVKCCYLLHLASSAMAEALAVKEGLSFANSLGYNDLIVPSDSMDVTETCTGEQV
jgi:ribonuclease HI